jgi:hypothetical protein
MQDGSSAVCKTQIVASVVDYSYAARAKLDDLGTWYGGARVLWLVRNTSPRLPAVHLERLVKVSHKHIEGKGPPVACRPAYDITCTFRPCCQLHSMETTPDPGSAGSMRTFCVIPHGISDCLGPRITLLDQAHNDPGDPSDHQRGDSSTRPHLRDD